MTCISKTWGYNLVPSYCCYTVMDIEIYCCADLLDINDVIFLEFYISYQLSVMSEIVVISDSISPVFYDRYMLLFVRYHISVISCQVSAIIDISYVWRYWVTITL